MLRILVSPYNFRTYFLATLNKSTRTRSELAVNLIQEQLVDINTQVHQFDLFLQN